MTGPGAAGPADGVTARRPRLADVAVRAGVSPGLVSLVLRGQPGPSERTRARVLAAARDLGYRADRTASLLARRRSRHLGVLMNVRNTFHAELVADLDEAATRAGYDLLLSAVTPARDERRAAEALLDFRCEALILLGPDDPAARLDALGRELPVVVVGRRIPPTSVDVVRAADDEGVAEAVGHLVGLGHRAIAFLDGGRGPIASDRRRGYRQAMRGHGLAGHIRIIPGDHTEEAGIRAGAALAAGRSSTTGGSAGTTADRTGSAASGAAGRSADAADRSADAAGHAAETAGQTTGSAGLPTAVVASNDRGAVGLLDALARRGVPVPGALSVVGYDDSPLARLAHVDLTTVSQDARQQAEQAVALAVERLDGGRTVPREVVLTPRLVVRRTTAPPAP